jgi:pimeloyl-ACP methyl ester carboxylesterase
MEPAYDAMTPWNETTDGDPAHPAVLFLHGFMGRREDWKPVVAALAEEYYCICPDLPGHGKNCLPGSGAGWEMAEAASGLMLLLNKYQIERCALVGYSMGGRLALYLAATYPKRFTRVVLESASPGLRTEEERAPRRQHDDNLADNIGECRGQPGSVPGFLGAVVHTSDFYVIARAAETARSTGRKSTGEFAGAISRLIAGDEYGATAEFVGCVGRDNATDVVGGGGGGSEVHDYRGRDECAVFEYRGGGFRQMWTQRALGKLGGVYYGGQALSCTATVV